MNESWAANNISRITGLKFEMSSSNFIDDSKMMELLQNEDGQDVFEEIDMGQIDEEDRPFLLIDKDTGRVYDMRNENHLKHLNEKQSKLTTDLNSSNVGSTGNKAWGDWWKQKHQNNQDYLIAAENGVVDEVKRLLDKEKLQELAAEINHKGLDCWTGLHFAANEGKLDVIKELLSHADVEVECYSSIMRTPLHLAAIRGHTDIVRALIRAGADKNVRDFDENTPLHYASEYGHFECIIFLVKEAEADPLIKNKFGYIPSDIAQNIKIRQLFDSILPRMQRQASDEEQKSFYGRTAYNGVLRHNDRMNMVQRLMQSYKTVDRFLQTNNK